jgi:hypothetical protein
MKCVSRIPSLGVRELGHGGPPQRSIRFSHHHSAAGAGLMPIVRGPWSEACCEARGAGRTRRVDRGGGRAHPVVAVIVTSSRPREASPFVSPRRPSARRDTTVSRWDEWVNPAADHGRDEARVGDVVGPPHDVRVERHEIVSAVRAARASTPPRNRSGLPVSSDRLRLTICSFRGGGGPPSSRSSEERISARRCPGARQSASSIRRGTARRARPRAGPGGRRRASGHGLTRAAARTRRHLRSRADASSVSSLRVRASRSIAGAAAPSTALTEPCVCLRQAADKTDVRFARVSDRRASSTNPKRSCPMRAR